MCEMCEARTESWILFPESGDLGGWSVVRATKDGDLMKKDEWGLVQCNEPDLVFETTPLPDPTRYLNDKQLNNIGSDPIFGESEFLKSLSDFRDEFYLSPEKGHNLFESAMRNGFNPKNDSFHTWIFHKMGELIQKEPDFKP